MRERIGTYRVTERERKEDIQIERNTGGERENRRTELKEKGERE